MCLLRLGIFQIFSHKIVVVLVNTSASDSQRKRDLGLFTLDKWTRDQSQTSALPSSGFTLSEAAPGFLAPRDQHQGHQLIAHDVWRQAACLRGVSKMKAAHTVTLA